MVYIKAIGKYLNDEDLARLPVHVAALARMVNSGKFDQTLLAAAIEQLDLKRHLVDQLEGALAGKWQNEEFPAGFAHWLVEYLLEKGVLDIWRVEKGTLTQSAKKIAEDRRQQ